MVSSWLSRRAPLSMQVGIIHGDFHFSNVLMRRDKGALAAIVDWELATIGDPLLDLAHLLVTWPGNSTVRSPSLEGVNLPTPEEVISHYAQQTNRDMTHLVWFRVLAAYRLGIILEGTNARAGADSRRERQELFFTKLPSALSNMHPRSLAKTTHEAHQPRRPLLARLIISFNPYRAPCRESPMSHSSWT